MTKRQRYAVGVGAASALGALAVGVAKAGRGLSESMGGQPLGARLDRMRQSPQFSGGTFHNRAAGTSTIPSGQGDVLGRLIRGAELRKPPVEIPLVQGGSEAAEAIGLQVTWYGHASALVELDGARILLDPVWSDRCSPSQQVGPKRLHPVPCSLAELGRVDAVVISHDHYDHLDMDSIKELAALGVGVFLVPLGVGAHLERWGVPEERIVERDWDEGFDIAGVRVTAVEAQHFSGRGLRRDGTLWASWVIAGESGRVFFSGDTGYFDGYPGIAQAYGPFDVALMAVGAYDPSWPTIHLNPEEAVEAAIDLGSPLVLPIHWCTFSLAPHPWAEPVERLLAAAGEAGVPVVIPRVGEQVDIAAPPAHDAWWSPASAVESADVA